MIKSFLEEPIDPKNVISQARVFLKKIDSYCVRIEEQVKLEKPDIKEIGEIITLLHASASLTDGLLLIKEVDN
jgi:hypothetical protein